MSSDQQYPHGRHRQQQYEDPYQSPPSQAYPAYPAYPQAYPPQDHPAQTPEQQPYEGSTQTWEGETWDTQYQPVLPQAGAAETAYPPPVTDSPRHAGAAQTAYLPPVANTRRHAGASDTPHLPPQGSHAQSPEPPVLITEGAPAEAADGYSAATTTGSARITDAQRARAEGRSPVIPPGIRPAGLTAVLGLLLAGGAAVGPYALLVPLVLLQAVTAAGWFRLNGMWPARQGIALAFAGGLAADIALLATGRENAPAAIIGTLGAWVLITLVLQLRSHASPDERMYGLMATVTSAALTILATGHLAAESDAVVVGGAAVAVAALARALPLPHLASVVLSLAAAAGAGIAAGGPTGLGAGGALLGLAAGVCALIGLRVASYDYPSRFVHFTAGVALPLTAAAPAVYLLGRALA